MATVKGDVHDIGKNIVGVVLQCNNYEVIDLGVMVPASTILETARREDVDIIGLSGLITPSLTEMVHVAKELQREGIDLPLLIGGATTSELHTAVKLEPVRKAPVIHVRDASRSVGVVSALLSDDRRGEFLSSRAAQYEALRQAHRAPKREMISLAAARANAFVPEAGYAPVVPVVPGRQVLDDVPVATLIPFIDWSQFLWAWGLKGRYPDILEDPEKGEEARRLCNDARELLATIATDKSIQMQAVFGIFPAARRGDDTIVYRDDLRRDEHVVLHHLRQQFKPVDGHPSLSLADFVAPEGDEPDYIGAFAVTAGEGGQALAEQFEEANDDFNAILVRVLADRLAEALAEWLHYRVRTHYWGTSPDEPEDVPGMLRLNYQGIRPAPGYPACPDHTEKEEIFELLDVPAATGMTLTESRMMTPPASVCGLYFAHPEARYFSVGRLLSDQIADYATRKGMPLDEVRRWLESNLVESE